MGNIKTVKLAMGWTPMHRRPACQNCRHAEQRQSVGITSWWCRPGAYLTSALAVCDRHAPVGHPLREG